MNTHDVRFVWLKSAIRDGMKFTWKYPNVLGLFLDGKEVLFGEAGEKVNNGVLIPTCINYNALNWHYNLY